MHRQQIVAILCVLISGVATGEDFDFAPRQDLLPVPAPADAVVLFDGNINLFRSMSGGEIDWPIEQGCLVSTRGNNRVNHLVSQLHFRDAEITELGMVTVWLNGQKVQDDTRFGEAKSVYHPFRYGTTPYLQKIAERMKQTQVGPVFLQDHDSPTRYRNIWVRPLDERSFVDAATGSGAGR